MILPTTVGNLAEVRFVHDSMAHGYSPAVPWGGQPGYDLILTAGNRSIRVQVKSVDGKLRQGRRCPSVNMQGPCIYATRRKKKRYVGYDVVAVYIRSEAAWVFLTRQFVGGRQACALPYSIPRNNWEFFRRREHRPTLARV